MARLLPLPAVLVLLAALTGCAGTNGVPGSTAAPPTTPITVLAERTGVSSPAAQARIVRFQTALTQAPYILALAGLDPAQESAQGAALADERVQTATRTADGQRLRAEVMTVAVARVGDLPPALRDSCAVGCVRVIVYVHPTATTLTIIVAATGTVLDMQALPNTQPEIPRELAELATQIARTAPETAQALGVTPSEVMALMSGTKTSVEGTACERRRHLCVAPVFRWGDRALWTIVDLTDYTLVAASAWTEQGQSGRRVVSEATLQDEALAPLCDTPQQLARDGWALTYLLTSSDGLELRDVQYQGRLILASVKVVDWHVGYATTNDQRVGFSDAIGCPVFSSAAVIPYGPPHISDVDGGGFVLAMTFRSPNWPQACNYQYTLTATFNPAGAATILAGNEGRGCGVDGLYHPVLRIEPVAGATLALSDGATATPLTTEGTATWEAGATPQLVATVADQSFTIAPAWEDATRAYVFWTLAKDAEGRGDLPSIGTCCNLDSRQGPEQLIDPAEALGRTPVLWYVPAIANAERARCWADSRLVDGLLTAEVWPCHAGVVVRVSP